MVMRLQEVLVLIKVLPSKIVNDKKKIIYIIALVVLTISSSCTKDFEEINTNSNAQKSVQPSLLLRQVIYNFGGLP
jgi:hypothetical protein